MLCTLIDAKVQKSLQKTKTIVRFASSFTGNYLKSNNCGFNWILLSAYMETIELLAMTTKILLKKHCQGLYIHLVYFIYIVLFSHELYSHVLANI